MISRNIFRLLVLLFIFFATMTFVAEKMFPWEKTHIISQALMASYINLAPDVSSVIVYGLLIVSSGLVAVAIIGLLFFWGPARGLFLAGYGVLIAANWLTQDPLIISYLANIYTHLTSILGGFLICSMFFTNVHYYFIAERKIWSGS